MTTDEALVAGLKNGDAAAFDRLHALYGPAMYDFAASLLRSADEALDLVQEAYVVALTSVERFREESSLKTWLFGILVNKARERRRKLGREVPESSLPDDVAERLDARGHWADPPQRWEDPSGRMDRQALARLAAEEMGALGETQQAVLRLRDVEGFDTAEVAGMLGITEINVRVTLHRARTALRERLERRLGAGRGPDAGGRGRARGAEGARGIVASLVAFLLAPVGGAA